MPTSQRVTPHRLQRLKPPSALLVYSPFSTGFKPWTSPSQNTTCFVGTYWGRGGGNEVVASTLRQIKKPELTGKQTSVTHCADADRTSEPSLPRFAMTLCVHVMKIGFKHYHYYYYSLLIYFVRFLNCQKINLMKNF